MKTSRLLQEAVAGILQRPSRSVLTVIGVTIGVGSFIAVLGVTSTANGQIGSSFNSQVSTQISVHVADSARVDPVTQRVLPDEADALVSRVDGVVHAGTSWDVPFVSVEVLQGVPVEETRVVAATAGYWDVVAPEMESGRVFDSFLEDKPVAVIGAPVARALNLADLDGNPTVFIDGRAFSVIGIVATTGQSSSPLSAVVIPAAFARAHFGEPGSAVVMSVTTAVGATSVVAAQLAVAIDPVHPENYRVLAPEVNRELRDQVSSSVQGLFIALALICLLVGAVGITNSALVGVMARTPEIGIRRSLGALPRHIAAQFLIETGVLGVFGGIFGAWAGLLTVIVVAMSQQWTAVVQPWSIFAAPAVGALVGLVAGLYPALRAARIEPVEAFRR
jgi:putative ABC transport system permease protein